MKREPGRLGRAVAQQVSHATLTADARVLSQVIFIRICGAKSGTGRGFSAINSSFP
jgi:hypothetical protein